MRRQLSAFSLPGTLRGPGKAGALSHFEEAKRLYDTHGIVSFANRAAAHDRRRHATGKGVPVYIAAYRFARQERLQGVADEAWKNIFRRSPEVSAMNQALANGAKPDDLLISAPVLTAAPEHVAPVSWN